MFLHTIPGFPQWFGRSYPKINNCPFLEKHPNYTLALAVLPFLSSCTHPYPSSMTHTVNDWRSALISSGVHLLVEYYLARFLVRSNTTI